MLLHPEEFNFERQLPQVDLSVRFISPSCNWSN